MYQRERERSDKQKMAYQMHGNIPAEPRTTMTASDMTKEKSTAASMLNSPL